MAAATKNVPTIDQLLDSERARTDEAFKVAVLGHALVALFQRQTRDEQSTNQTNKTNNVGFAGSDARTGSISAKYYIKYKTLLPFTVETWLRPNANGRRRICKYSKQLQRIAQEKQSAV